MQLPWLVDRPLPADPQASAEIYQEFLESVLPYPPGNDHPRFWGWVFGTGNVMGAFGAWAALAPSAKERVAGMGRREMRG